MTESRLLPVQIPAKMIPVTYGHDYWIPKDGADTRKIRDRLLTIEAGGRLQNDGGGESSFTSTKTVLAIWGGGGEEVLR